ncbi:MAG: SURF1 family protein [Steroidobacteraceae bacterium]
MSGSSPRRRFAPRPWAVALAVLATAGCLALAHWQLGRAREKEALIAAFDAGGGEPAPLTVGTLADRPRYQHVTVAGRYEPARQVLLDNMPSSTGQAGYRVLTPFRPEGGGPLVIVDRGWVPLGPDRTHLPAVTVADAPRSVTGRLDRLPVPGLRLGEARAPGEAGWPLVLNFPVQADLEAALGEPVEPRIVLLDADQPDGYERVWRPALGFPPERHLGYAIQWLALALVVLAAFVATALQPGHPDTDHPT